MAHTPRPWHIDEEAKNISSVSIRGADGKAVCACRFRGPDGKLSGDWIRQTRDDARLIAAAPELVAALEAITETELPERDNLAWREVAQQMKGLASAALAKAKEST